MRICEWAVRASGERSGIEPANHIRYHAPQALRPDRIALQSHTSVTVILQDKGAVKLHQRMIWAETHLSTSVRGVQALALGSIVSQD